MKSDKRVRTTQTRPAELRAALYLRVSTGRQAEHDLSIPDQRQQLQSWCRAQGYAVTAEFVEAGASATDDRRPAFQQMIERACDIESAFDVIIVLQKAVPIALQKGKPGTPEFRQALKDAFETMGRTPVSQGVLSWTPADHFGYTPETGVLLRVANGDWQVVP